jgi:hypothetical protein
MGLILSAPGHKPGDMLLSATLTGTSGVIGNYQIRATADVTGAYFSARLSWRDRQIPGELIITPTAHGVTLLGMTSIDVPAGAYLSQPVRGQYDMRLVHSGDVKIYANERSAPRAFLAGLSDCSTVDGQLVVNETSAGQAVAPNSQATVVRDEPEELELAVQAQAPGWLVVRDAYYPGWSARIDGVSVPIRPVDLMFRAVPIQPGKHTVTFTYEPFSVRLGAILSVLGVIAWLVLALLVIRRR